MSPHPGLMPLDLAFSFDTTGSMGSVIGQVRSNITEMLNRLKTDITDLKVALIAHGDYGDTYETKIKDFGTSTADLVTFAKTVSMTGGSDEPECYELVLQQARTHLSWRPNSSRALVLVGDSFPHELGSARNKYNIDWKAEVQLLRQLGVTVYCVQCRESASVTHFMKSVADATGGLRLPLAEFRGVRDFLMAIAYREGGTNALQDVYEREVRARDGTALPGDVDVMLGLVRRASKATSCASTKIISSSSSTKIKTGAKPTKTKMGFKPAAVVAAKRVKMTAKTTRNKKPRATNSSNIRVRRESCSSKNLPASLASLSWSPWRLVAMPGSHYMSGSGSSSSWQPFGSASVRRSLLSSGNLRSSLEGPLTVELAVQPRPGARRYPLFGRVLSVGGRPSAGTFRHLLAGRGLVRAQLLRVLRQGMRVFARVGSSGRPAAPSVTARLRPVLAKEASYAWNSGRSARCSGVFVSVSKRSLC